jgi:hypothetical protein
MTDDIEIRLPATLVEKCEARIDGTEFDSVEAYVRFVMGAVVADADDPDIQTDEDSGVDEDVEDRLASLGYK